MGKKCKKKHRKPTDYIVFTDGGCAYNPGGPGACAAIVQNRKTHEKKEYSKAYQSTTNNRMEIMAVIMALENISSGSVFIYSDSQYVINTMTGKFRKKTNHDLWARLEAATQGKTIYLEWVRGHSGVPDNERCDELCRIAMQSISCEPDEGYSTNRTITKVTNQNKQGSMGVEIQLPEPFASEMFSECPVSTYMVKYSVKEKCAEEILRFFKTGRFTFKNYLDLKTDGMDGWSRKSKAYIENILQEQGMDDTDILWNIICKYIYDEKNRMFCLRWYMRGLPLYHAIRKTLVSQEVQENCK